MRYVSRSFFVLLLLFSCSTEQVQPAARKPTAAGAHDDDHKRAALPDARQLWDEMVRQGNCEDLIKLGKLPVEKRIKKLTKGGSCDDSDTDSDNDSDSDDEPLLFSLPQAHGEASSDDDMIKILEFIFKDFTPEQYLKVLSRKNSFDRNVLDFALCYALYPSSNIVPNALPFAKALIKFLPIEILPKLLLQKCNSDREQVLDKALQNFEIVEILVTRLSRAIWFPLLAQKCLRDDFYECTRFFQAMNVYDCRDHDNLVRDCKNIVKIVRLLLAQLTPYEKYKLLKIPCFWACPPLVYAVKERFKPDIIAIMCNDLMKEQLNDLYSQTDISSGEQNTVLHLAASWKEKPHVLQLLLYDASDEVLDIKNADGKTAREINPALFDRCARNITTRTDGSALPIMVPHRRKALAPVDAKTAQAITELCHGVARVHVEEKAGAEA